jgi:hypothetical protein
MREVHVSIEAMKQARDFISRLKFADAEPEPEIVMAVLDQAIAEAEKQEPVAWMNKHGACKTNLFREVEAGAKDEYTIPLYTHPPKREWRGLTDEELEELRRSDDLFEDAPMWSLIARAIEAKLKEKNNGQD